MVPQVVQQVTAAQAVAVSLVGSGSSTRLSVEMSEVGADKPPPHLPVFCRFLVLHERSEMVLFEATTEER